MFEAIQILLAPIRLAAGTVDRSLAAGGFHNARKALRQSELNRAAWTQVMEARHDADRGESVA